jgi:uncharacterized protein YecE (DUF72 family)
MRSARMARIRIGISGWRYEPWRGVFYPQDLPASKELWYASRKLSAIEINGSFYSLQRPEYYEQWYAETPRNFMFAVKGPRFITHMKRLNDIEIPLANFYASGVLRLRDKLGPFLWQFPPNFIYRAETLDHFFSILPRDTVAASQLATQHDARLEGRSDFSVDRCRRLRHAIEIRHESFLCEEFIALLRRHRIALVVAESAGRWPLVHDVTASFMYLRLHGDKHLYRSGYSAAALQRWATKIRCWSDGRVPANATRISDKSPQRRAAPDVYCFFDNTDDKLRAPRDAQTLMRLLQPPAGIE